MKTLPDKLSELIDLALVDLEEAENDRQYEVDMYTWHSPRPGRCAVCLAGCVMAKSLGASPIMRLTSASTIFDCETQRKLEALDCVRTYSVWRALMELGMDEETASDVDRRVNARFSEKAFYKDDPEKFKANMRRMAAALREEGL